MELRKIKALEIAATSLALAHFKLSMNGERKMPPPIPTIPESKPSSPPTTALTHTGGAFTTEPSCPLISKMRSPAKNRLPVSKIIKVRS